MKLKDVIQLLMDNPPELRVKWTGEVDGVKIEIDIPAHLWREEPTDDEMKGMPNDRVDIWPEIGNLGNATICIADGVSLGEDYIAPTVLHKLIEFLDGKEPAYVTIIQVENE